MPTKLNVDDIVSVTRGVNLGRRGTVIAADQVLDGGPVCCIVETEDDAEWIHVREDWLRLVES